MSKKKKLLFAAIIIVCIFLIQSAPIWILKTPNMDVIDGQQVQVNYERGDELGAREVFDLLEASAGQLSEKLGLREASKTMIYVYKNQSTFHLRKAGFVTLFFDLKWYIGDNKKDVVLIVSPYSKNAVHDHDSILGAAQHELIHAINYQINPNLSYWLDNGIAGYLSHQEPRSGFINDVPVPSFDDTRSENQIEFSEFGGYQYSYLYVDYIDRTYGWDAVKSLLSGEPFENVFGKSERAIYDEWVQCLESSVHLTYRVSE